MSKRKSRALHASNYKNGSHWKSEVYGLGATNKSTATTFDRIKNFLAGPDIKTLFNTGHELMNAVSPFTDKPNAMNGARAAFNIGKILVNKVEIWAETYFMGDEWAVPFGDAFNNVIMSTVATFPMKTIKCADPETTVKIVDVNGIKIGWISNKGVQSPTLYVETAHRDEARQEIKRLLWERFNSRSLVLRRPKAVLTGPNTGTTFEHDDLIKPIQSVMATTQTNYIKRALDAGINRSMMLYGPPGTGKSTMARTIVDNLGLRSIRIRLEDLHIDKNVFADTVLVFEPDAVILDDFDRVDSETQAQLLETLTFFEKHVKLTIVTVNDKSRLDDAVVRPERIDELILVDRMDDDVVKLMLGEYVDGFEQVKTWPVVFINEYVKRRKFMSKEEAVKGCADLARRVKNFDKYRDLDATTIMTDGLDHVVDGRCTHCGQACVDVINENADKKEQDPSVDELFADMTK